MLPSRGLLRSGVTRGLGRPSLSSPSTRLSTRQISPVGCRQFGTVLQGNGAKWNSALLRRSAGSSNGLYRSVAVPGSLLSSQILLTRNARFASTETSTGNDAASAASTIPTDIGVSPTPIDLTGTDLLNMPEQIGYLKAMGLEFGWGVTSTMQWLLEHVYIYTGLPWWASLATVAVLIRAAIFKPSLVAAEASQRTSDLMKDPKYKEVMARFQMATIGGGRDQNEMMNARMEMMRMQKANGVSMWKSFVPLVNIPIGIGMIRLLRGMSALPVPSMEYGGLWWFSDLTVADPYFILPIASAAVAYASMARGFPYMAESQRGTMKLMSYVLVPVGALVTMYMPAGLQLYFLFMAMSQYVQSWLFYQPWLRRWAGLRPLQKAEAAAPTTQSANGSSTGWQAPRTITTTARPAESEAKSENVITLAKSKFRALSEKVDASAEKRKAGDRLKAAKEYEERRRLEDEADEFSRREAGRKAGKSRSV